MFEKTPKKSSLRGRSELRTISRILWDRRAVVRGNRKAKISGRRKIHNQKHKRARYSGVHTCSSALWEAKAGGLLEPRSWRPAWATK